jgi:serine incorporator 1/3
VTSAGWCFCTACASLLQSCCGNDKASSVPPSHTSGRKRSVLLLILAIALALAFQYGVAPAILEHKTWTSFVADNWTDGCTAFNSLEYQKSCAGNNGVYRVASSATVFFLLATIAVRCKPTANREAWPAKYVLFCFLCLATVFIPNGPYFSDIYLNIARMGAVLFIFIQQIVIIDVAHSWNDSWVAKGDKAEAEEAGSGKRWFSAILASCALLFSASMIGFVLVAFYFTGCRTNNAFIALTLILGILMIAAQMSGEEGSLLSSACMFCWAVFLCYTAVSKNPNGECNPKLGEVDRLSIGMALVVTIMSMAWTGWSFTAEEKLTMGEEKETTPEFTDSSYQHSDSKPKVGGVVVGAKTSDEEAGPVNEAVTDDSTRPSNSWKLNLILAIISCWMAVSLTNWGAISDEGNAANPQVGRIGMWMVIVAQWIALSLYVWTLVAPRLFPDRDFS